MGPLISCLLVFLSSLSLPITAFSQVSPKPASPTPAAHPPRPRQTQSPSIHHLWSPFSSLSLLQRRRPKTDIVISNHQEHNDPNRTTIPEQPPDLLIQLTIKQTSPNEFQTLHPPRKMGNPLNIAYGDYTLAAAAKATCLSVPEGYHLYSLQGNFLGPAYTNRILCASVRSVRQTRVFGTRVVEVWQPSPASSSGKEEEEEEEARQESRKQDPGRKRPCLFATADFMVSEPHSLLSYSAKPLHAYPTWSACPTRAAVFQDLVRSGKIEETLLKAHNKSLALLNQQFEQRLPTCSIFAHNLSGLAKQLPHPQDNLPISERTTAHWIKSIEPIPSTVDNVTALAFLMDSAIAFLPLSFNHAWLDDVAAVSSLDFSLRLFTDDVRVDRWCLRELRNPVAGQGRSFGEAWVWDQDGKAVACMSQQSILRPAKGKL